MLRLIDERVLHLVQAIALLLLPPPIPPMPRADELELAALRSLRWREPHWMAKRNSEAISAQIDFFCCCCCCLIFFFFCENNEISGYTRETSIMCFAGEVMRVDSHGYMELAAVAAAARRFCRRFWRGYVWGAYFGNFCVSSVCVCVRVQMILDSLGQVVFCLEREKLFQTQWKTSLYKNEKKKVS